MPDLIMTMNHESMNQIKIIMKKYIILLLCSQLMAHSSLLSQDIFISKGKIEFEKRVNIYKNLMISGTTMMKVVLTGSGQMKKADA
jgi:hypothetical protein